MYVFIDDLELDLSLLLIESFIIKLKIKVF